MKDASFWLFLSPSTPSSVSDDEDGNAVLTGVFFRTTGLLLESDDDDMARRRARLGAGGLVSLVGGSCFTGIVSLSFSAAVVDGGVFAVGSVSLDVAVVAAVASRSATDDDDADAAVDRGGALARVLAFGLGAAFDLAVAPVAAAALDFFFDGFTTESGL